MGIVAATLIGPDDINSPIWYACYDAAKEWTKRHVVLEDVRGEAFGNESEWRRKLWRQALGLCENGDWIFVLDADFLLTGDPNELCASDASSWSFRLYDLWDYEHYRTDAFWRAHLYPRPWMFRASSAPDEPEWNPRGIHVGHAPANFPTGNAVAPDSISILHLGWMTTEIRRNKIDRYERIANQLSIPERLHLNSVGDPKPPLLPLPTKFRECLESWLELPVDDSPTS